MAPAHDERIEIRVAGSEAERWRKVAAQENLPLSEWLRKHARKAAAPSAFRELLSELRDHIERHKKRYPEHPCILSLTHDDELVLLRATRADVGEVVFARLLESGPRVAFQSIFGARVEWNEKHRGSRPDLESEPRTEAQS